MYGLQRSAAFSSKQWEIWTAIVRFQFDEPGTRRTFSVRLIEHTGWTPMFADGAIAEYRKFLFLAVAAGHPITPSLVIDEVWHLHLQDTRSYWQRLCREVLKQDFHHEPSKGGEAEDSKYAQQYERTLDSYERFFGEVPEQYWGGRKKRTESASQQKESTRSSSSDSSSSFVATCGTAEPVTEHRAGFFERLFGGGESGGAGGGGIFSGNSQSCDDSGGSHGGDSGCSDGGSGGSSCGGGGSSCGGGGGGCGGGCGS